MTDTLLPCNGGPHGSVGWLRVPLPLPVEIERDDGGVYVLDERADGASYVWVSLDS